MLFSFTPTECAQALHFYFFSALEDDIDAQIEEVRNVQNDKLFWQTLM